MIELERLPDGCKHCGNILIEVPNYLKLNESAKLLYNDRIPVAVTCYIKRAGCVKVTDSDGNIAYFDPKLFEYVDDHSTDLYLTVDGDVLVEYKHILIGVCGNKIIGCAPVYTRSVEPYL